MKTTLVNTLKSMPAQAEAAKDSIVRGDFTEFGQLFTQYFEAKKVSNPNTTNNVIEDLISRVDSLCDGRSIAGAGGGGFMMFLLKETADKDVFYESIKGMGSVIYEWSVAN